MCGIIGYTGKSISVEHVLARLRMLSHRGKDHLDISDGQTTGSADLRDSTFFVGHTLHAVVDFVLQPLGHCFVTNCEIYNWQHLAKKYKLLARNDAELLYLLLQKEGIACLKELDGDYAFIWKSGNRIFAARDILGVKPLCYAQEPAGTWFASENKVLEHGQLLDPRKILIMENNIITFLDKPFFSLNELNISREDIVARLQVLLVDAVRKRLHGLDKVGILFSGGVDSTLLAVLTQRSGKEVFLYTAGVEASEDIIWARKVASFLCLPLRIALAQNIEDEIRDVITVIETTDVMKVGVALPFHLACRMAKADGCKVILSGLGSEELFAGYRRHKEAKDINNECLNGLLSMHSRDLYRDDTITMAHQLELRVPFLDDALVTYALSIPGKYKLEDGQDKAILRQAALLLGVPKAVAYRKKRAAQYGSGCDLSLIHN